MSNIYTVKEGAELSCSLGSINSILKVPKGHGACIQGRKEAVITDNEAGINIMPFGTCSKTNPPLPCTPIITLPWQMGKKDYLLNGEPALLNTCILPCVCGGIIRIEEDGQRK